MRDNWKIVVVIPALDEEETIGLVLDRIPKWVDRVILGDNGSKDRTAQIAKECGAEVVYEPRRGYGSACLAALERLASTGDDSDSTLVVFLDGDFSDDPLEMELVVNPIVKNGVDLVIGSRVRGTCEPGALTPTQRFGNGLSCFLTQLFFGQKYSDLGPFRAVRLSALNKMNLKDPGYGWTIRMQIRAAHLNMSIAEVPVSYRHRAGGKSKVSGTVRGVIGAGTIILSIIFAEAIRDLKRG